MRKKAERQKLKELKKKLHMKPVLSESRQKKKALMEHWKLTGKQLRDRKRNERERKRNNNNTN